MNNNQGTIGVCNITILKGQQQHTEASKDMQINKQQQSPVLFLLFLSVFLVNENECRALWCTWPKGSLKGALARGNCDMTWIKTAFKGLAKAIKKSTGMKRLKIIQWNKWIKWNTAN